MRAAVGLFVILALAGQSAGYACSYSMREWRQEKDGRRCRSEGGDR